MTEINSILKNMDRLLDKFDSQLQSLIDYLDQEIQKAERELRRWKRINDE